MLKKETNELRILTETCSLILMLTVIKLYTKETNETLKLRLKKRETEKSIYKIQNTKYL